MTYPAPPICGGAFLSFRERKNGKAGKNVVNAYFLVGEILKPQGIHGECKVKPYAADTESFRTWKTLYFRKGDTYSPVKCECTRIHDGFVYMRMEGCTTPEDVERVRGESLYVDREHAAQLEEGEYYIADLLGCEAVDEKGEVIGKLKDILQYGTVDTYVFTTPKGTMMAPALERVFPKTDIAEKRILVCRERLDEVAVYED